MSALTRFGPFRVPARFDPFTRDLDDLFKGMFAGNGALAEGMAGHIPVNVTEDEKAYTVRAEMPGFRKEDIRVEVVGDQLALSAERQKTEERREGENVVINECYYGRQYRSLKLPMPVDATGVKASYADGVLQLVLPKQTGGEKRAITID
ncbi:MAG: Hsp20/alpha crystallin family protein [Pseudomonadota bacterium]|nr:Hsp20/alpha crystallin family protein [Pseudomonadota bacterium]